MPRSSEDIIKQADDLANRFEDHTPGSANLRSAATLQRVRQAFLLRADAEKELRDAVEAARVDGQSWAAIGAMLGTSGEAARQRYSATTV